MEGALPRGFLHPEELTSTQDNQFLCCCKPAVVSHNAAHEASSKEHISALDFQPTPGKGGKQLGFAVRKRLAGLGMNFKNRA